MNQASITYRKLQAPPRNGDYFIEPPISESLSYIHANQQRLAAFADIEIGGLGFTALRRQARGEIITAAREYTQTYLDLSHTEVTETTSIVLTGHQPTLFHPGVWFKNFCLDHIAKHTQSLAINLIIDHDLVKSTSIKVPAQTGNAVILKTIAYDVATASNRIETTGVLDENLFNSFPQRVADQLDVFVEDPILKSFWKHAQQASTNVIGYKFSQARHQLEHRLGMKSWDVPFSTLCRGACFARLFLHLMKNASRFRKVHNAAVCEYRKVHRIRNLGHPVPELEILADRIELPLWSWTSSTAERQRLFCQVTAEQLILSDLPASFELRLDLAASSNECIEQLQAWQQTDIQFRSRALLTTMFSRLLLGDLFIHGIGGGKYDQVTDQIISEFFGQQPPQFSIATATLGLPVPLPTDGSPAIAAATADLRHLQFAPDKYLRRLEQLGIMLNSQQTALLIEKQQLLKDSRATSDKQAWHHTIQKINQDIRNTLPAAAAQLETHRQQLETTQNERTLLQSREFPFILFPLKNLASLLETSMKTF
ncbi:MAG: hypothetical protein HN617_01510 [Planctomycetaceae bacterium]|jgi:hypothetical protein|nr:hypothetical protein [Planctomycetaceae bacterium]MBT4012666.1 hypothetical protein [Planctomycetaceae bacterium]MBT4724576.1 hypothetical protein [Planctomycetaceae bacterium]MBT4844327.1 hypothetical protein [Planctomycetaceae bacterium]MBT5123609.1 hypothetical protein [Planctomycetaceae bacterium]